mmetsp:Transcript_16782/g.37083  ORF Transcript_16782/g.37083 Transcript_16782/m.37083 type:complete len:369 (+) Transcript_16782:641-1747(+)
MQLVVLFCRVHRAQFGRTPPAEGLIEVKNRAVCEVRHPSHGLKEPKPLDGPIFENNVNEPAKDIIGQADRWRGGHLRSRFFPILHGLVAEPQGIHVARHAPQRRAAELGGAQQHPPLSLKVGHSQVPATHGPRGPQPLGHARALLLPAGEGGGGHEETGPRRRVVAIAGGRNFLPLLGGILNSLDHQTSQTAQRSQQTWKSDAEPRLQDATCHLCTSSGCTLIQRGERLHGLSLVPAALQEIEEGAFHATHTGQQYYQANQQTQQAPLLRQREQRSGGPQQIRLVCAFIISQLFQDFIIPFLHSLPKLLVCGQSLTLRWPRGRATAKKSRASVPTPSPQDQQGHQDPQLPTLLPSKQPRHDRKMDTAW